MSNEKHNPEPGEIREACERIRATWSRSEERRRRVVEPERWTAPSVAYDDELPAE